MVDLKDLFVGGVGGAGALAAIAPAFSVEQEKADLWHVTRFQDAQSIAEQGLVRGMEPPASKQAKDYAEEAGDTMEMYEEPEDSRAERELQNLLADAKRKVSGVDDLPAHRDALFFWSRESDAEKAADNVGFGAVIVGVDLSKVPNGCTMAMGPTHIPDDIYKQIYDAYRGRGTYDEQELFEAAKDYWREVQPYDSARASSKDEVWTQCDIPPRAIEYIENPRTGRIVERPTEQSQATLRRFEQ